MPQPCRAAIQRIVASDNDPVAVMEGDQPKVLINRGQSIDAWMDEPLTPMLGGW